MTSDVRPKRLLEDHARAIGCERKLVGWHGRRPPRLYNRPGPGRHAHFQEGLCLTFTFTESRWSGSRSWLKKRASPCSVRCLVVSSWNAR